MRTGFSLCGITLIKGSRSQFLNYALTNRMFLSKQKNLSDRAKLSCILPIKEKNRYLFRLAWMNASNIAKNQRYAQVLIVDDP
jgi:hypothetical protein